MAFNAIPVMEELLPAFAESFPWPAIAVDQAGMVVHANASMRDRGVSCADPGRISLAKFVPEYFGALRGKKPWRTEQSATIRRETSCGPVHEQVWLRKVPGGSCLVIVDCTPARESDAASAQAAQTARLASLGFMVAGVCHEVSNPLSAIHSMVQILRSERGVSHETLDKGLANIQANVRRLIDVARRLTDFSRVGEEERRPFQIDWAVEEALILSRQHAAFGIRIDHQPEPGAVVFGRSGQLQQVIYNIVLNAIQVLKGSGHIRVAVSCTRGGGVEVAIRDDGPGIRPADLARVFDPFFTTKASGEGTGLGLAISNEIVAEHGGSIRVENNTTQGATFYVHLPLHEGLKS